MNTNNLTVLILAAGYGRRMGQFSRMVNKGLIPYDNRALISHIIEKFPKETTKFVIACGYLGQQIKDYVLNVHFDKNIVTVDIPDFSEENTGPATTIQHCKEHIRGGFLWVSCDTLFDFNYEDRMNENWIGVYPVDSVISQDYCWVKRDGNDIIEINNKKHNNSAVDAFIGLMYAKDDEYLNNLITNRAKETYEGFKNLNLKAYTVSKWMDFGTYEKWHQHNEKLPEISFPKPDELFYHDNKSVIKYFTKEENVFKRVERAKANPNCTPKNMKGFGNFLIHDWVEGDILYNQINPRLFEKMLLWCKQNLWINPTTDPVNEFELCTKFYKEKTIERVDQFRVKYSDWSECCVVNKKEVDSIDNYLSKINWNWLSSEKKWCWIHGDLHFDNMIYDSKNEKFTAIDWRTDFAGNIYGDMYYDLAKLLGGIWLNYRMVKEHRYSYNELNDYSTIEIPSVENAQIYEDILRSFVLEQHMNWEKIKILVPLIYLNMSPLHEPPFDKFLISLAQLHFSKGLI